jgi:putative transposase
MRELADLRMHTISAQLAQKYGTIVFENLNIQGLAQGVLSKQLRDASWSQFVPLLKYKAENAGRRVIEVDPRYTQKDASRAGAYMRKCGYTRQRDPAADKNLGSDGAIRRKDMTSDSMSSLKNPQALAVGSINR